MPCAFETKRWINRRRLTSCQFDIDESELIEHDGKRWCQFHAPLESGKGEWEEQYIDAFNESIHAFIAAAKKANSWADLSGVVFAGAIDFSRYREENALPPIAFRQATFSGDANFHRATFSGYAYFPEATFSGDADFSNAAFSRPAWFVAAMFEGTAKFDNAAFSCRTAFDYAKFSGDATFGEATFSGQTYFNEAMFGGAASFDSAMFEDTVVFRATMFGGAASFDSATFDGLTIFSDATFGGNSWFLTAAFSDNSFFENTAFRGFAGFDKSTFNSPTSFKETMFSGPTSFVETTFKNTSDFSTTKFNGPAWSYVTFGGVATLNDDAKRALAPAFHDATVSLGRFRFVLEPSDDDYQDGGANQEIIDDFRNYLSERISNIYQPQRASYRLKIERVASGSIEIDLSLQAIMSGAVGIALYQFIKDYPRLKEGAMALAKDTLGLVKKMGGTTYQVIEAGLRAIKKPKELSLARLPNEEEQQQ